MKLEYTGMLRPLNIRRVIVRLYKCPETLFKFILYTVPEVGLLDRILALGFCMNMDVASGTT